MIDLRSYGATWPARSLLLAALAAAPVTDARPGEPPATLPSPPRAAAPAAEPSPAPPAGAEPGSLTAPEMEALARSLIPVVEELRGMAFKSPVPVKIVDDAEARRHFSRRAERLWPERRARAEQTAYAQMGLLPAGTDLMRALFDVLEEQAGGYYDPESKTFYVLQDMPRALAPIILVHELTHALDDQHFSIDAPGGRPMNAEDEDGTLAYGSVVEGSGTLVMAVYVLREVQAGRLAPETLLELQRSETVRTERLGAAPAYLQRGLLAPYVLGQMFLVRGNLLALAQGVPTADVDRAFREPPVSSEQILHPEKYWDPKATDPPRPVTVPDLSGRLGEGWSLEAAGTLGEMDLALLAGAAVPDVGSPASLSPAAWTNPAVTGWGGARWHLYRQGERRATIAATVWDSEADAAEFEAALTPVEGRRSWRRGPAVVLVAGDAGDHPESLAGACLDALAPAPAAR